MLNFTYRYFFKSSATEDLIKRLSVGQEAGPGGRQGAGDGSGVQSTWQSPRS